MTRIRRGVAAGTLSGFVLAWGLIAHSGSMGEQAAASTASTGSTTSGTVTDDGSSGDGLGSTATDDGTTSSSDTPSASSRGSPDMLLAALGEHFSWITSRAAGVAALVASSAAVAAGLLMSGPARRRVPDLRAIHEALSLATLGALLLHALSLLGDEFLSPSLADIAVPFVSGYQRGWTSLGIVAGWMLLLLGLSYYARGRIGPARWRRLHRWTALAWVFGAVHGIAEGTDAGALWFVLAVLVAVVPVAALPAGRLAAPRPDATTAPA